MDVYKIFWIIVIVYIIMVLLEKKVKKIKEKKQSKLEINDGKSIKRCIGDCDRCNYAIWEEQEASGKIMFNGCRLWDIERKDGAKNDKEHSKSSVSTSNDTFVSDTVQ